MKGLRYLLIRTRVWMRFVLDLSPAEQRGVIFLILVFFVVDLWQLFDPDRTLPAEEAARLTHYVIEMEQDDPVKPMIPFMPDTVSENSLVSWGWPAKLASNLVRYRNKAGKFRSERQIRSLYGMTDSMFSVIRPYIILVESKPKIQPADTLPRKTSRCPQPMDLNMADSAMLTFLHGVGPVLSSRIVAYRELLGGYTSTEQLAEVYGLKKETFEHITDQLYVDSLFVPHKIPYRDGSYQDLYRHPYLDSRQAVFLIRFRQHHGSDDLLDALEKNPRFKKKDIRRLMPYLGISDSTSLPRQ